MYKLMVILLTGILTMACSAVQTPISNQYRLTAFSKKRLANTPSKWSILITNPEAASGYQTEQMLYIKKPYELTPFAKNAWVDQPADMLFSLLVQSLQFSGFFHAVASNSRADSTDYRLDTQLIELQQNFIKNPSVVDLTIKIVLSDVRNNRVVASKVISAHVPSPSPNPYGGVVAANRATEQVTAQVTAFVLAQIEQNHK